jgi:hypothetical protein
MIKWLKNLIFSLKLSLIQKWLNYLRNEDKHEILTLSVGELFNAVTEDDIFRYNKEINRWFYMDKELSESDFNLLKAEAINFRESKLWQVLQTEIEWQSNKRTFILSRTPEDLIAGKMALFNLDVIRTCLNKITQS